MMDSRATTSFPPGAGRRWGRVITALFAVGVVAGCAAQPIAGPAPARALDSTPSDLSAAQPDVAELVGAVNVNALPYGLSEATGYDTAIAFTVVNPSDFPMISPYRVTVSGGGRILDTTDGSDQVVLAPHQQLLVVNRPQDVRDTPPDSASVTFYSNEAGQMVLPDPAAWQLDNVSTPSCDDFIVGCEVNADLIYAGETNIDMQLAIREVAITFTEGGRTVLAGTLSRRGGSSDDLIPGKPIPVSGYVVGDVGDATGLDHQFGVQVVVPRY